MTRFAQNNPQHQVDRSSRPSLTSLKRTGAWVVGCVASLGLLVGPLGRSSIAQVVINGYVVEGQDLAMLEAMVGSYIPDGRYWLDTYTGYWGYEGNPTIQGNIYAGADNSSGGGSGSGYFNYSSPSGGSLTGDGRCLYFSSEFGSASTC